MTGEEFEEYLKAQFERQGFKVKLTPGSNDYGADLVLNRNGEVTVVQAKRYQGNVGNKAVQEIVAAQAYYGADRAMVVTNSYFTNPAKKLAEANDVELWDRDNLIQKVGVPRKGRIIQEEYTEPDNEYDSASSEEKQSREYKSTDTISDIIGESNISQEDADLAEEFADFMLRDLYDYSMRLPKNKGIKHLLKWVANKLYLSGWTAKEFEALGIKGLVQPGYKMKYRDQWIELLDVSDEHIVNMFDDEEPVVPDTLDVSINKRRILAFDSNMEELDEDSIDIIDCGDIYNITPELFD